MVQMDGLNLLLSDRVFKMDLWEDGLMGGKIEQVERKEAKTTCRATTRAKFGNDL